MTRREVVNVITGELNHTEYLLDVTRERSQFFNEHRDTSDMEQRANVLKAVLEIVEHVDDAVIDGIAERLGTKPCQA